MSDKRPTGHPILGKRAAARVTPTAGLDFPTNKGGGEIARRIAGARIDPPDDIAPLVEADQQTFGPIFRLAEWPPTLLRARPCDVARALAVAGLAADADLGPGGGEAVFGGVVILVHAGRVALRAHEIPVLVQLGPMQDIIVLDLLARIEMKPALPALLLRPAVPGDRERLQPAVRKFDEILLQRIDAEGVFHLERRELAVRPVGLDEKLALRRFRKVSTP